MIELFLRTAFMCFLMEIGSASNFTIAAIANSSPRWAVVFIAGLLGIACAEMLAIKLGGLLNRLPISSNIISGTLMVVLGLIYLCKDSA